MNAGIFIALAAILYVRCPDRILGSFLFSTGLLACLLYKAGLCTGIVNQPWHELYRPSRRDLGRWTSWLAYQSAWWVVFVINGFFALWLGCMARLCIDVSAVNAIVAAKIAHPWYWILFMGFLCGSLIQIAVHAWDKSRGGWPIVVLCVAAFLLMGGEHCIANAAFIGMQDGDNGWEYALGCVKLVGISAIGNNLAGALFYKES